MPGYRVVDLRDQIAPGHSSWGNSPKGAGVIQHYNGGPVPARAWNKPIQWIRFINDLHKQPGRFASGWQINGIAYCEWVIGNTVYRLRDFAADLPHCGNLYYNRNAIGLHIPVGGSQRPQDAGKGTMLTAMRRADDHLRAMGLSRQHYRGHREVGASACPGDPIMEQIQRYRQGMDVQPPKEEAAKKPPESPVQSAPSDTVYKVLVGAFSQRSYADATASQLKAKGFGSYVYQSGSYHRVQAAALSDPVAADELVIKLKAAGWKDAYALAEKA